MEYYLLYYDRWERDDESSNMVPVLTYCVSIGKLSDAMMEKLAGTYGIYSCDKKGCWNYSNCGFLADLSIHLSSDGILCVPADQFHGLRDDGLLPFCEIRPRQTLSEGLKVLCATALANFKEANREGTTDGRIAFMRKVIIAADILREDIPVSESENDGKPVDKKKKRTKGDLKLLIEATVELYGDDVTGKLIAEKAEIDNTMLSREPYSTYLEEARKKYRIQRNFENQFKASFDEKQYHEEQGMHESSAR